MKKEEKDVWLLGLASFFNDAGTELITPLLPTLTIMFGGNEIIIGLISAIKEALPPLINFIGGFIAEKFGIKKTTIFSYILSGLSKIGIGFSTNLAFLVSFISLDRIGKGIRGPARDVWISQLMNKTKGKGFAIRQMLDSAGALLGSLLVLYLVNVHVPIQHIILLGGLFGMLAFIPIFSIPGSTGIISKTTNLNVKPIYVLFTFLMYFTAFGVIIALSLTHSVSNAVFIFVLYNIVYILTTYPAGILADKFGKRKMLFLSLLFFLISNIFFIHNMLIYAMIGFGLAYGTFKSNLKAFISDLIHDSVKKFGILEGSMGLGALTGNLLLGYTIHLFGLNAFYIPIVSALLSIFILLNLK